MSSKTDHCLDWFGRPFHNKHLNYSPPEACASPTQTDLATSEGHQLLGHVGKATRRDLVASQGRGMAVCCVEAGTHQHHVRVKVLEKRRRMKNQEQDGRESLSQNQMRTIEMTRMGGLTDNDVEEDEDEDNVR